MPRIKSPATPSPKVTTKTKKSPPKPKSTYYEKTTIPQIPYFLAVKEVENNMTRHRYQISPPEGVPALTDLFLVVLPTPFSKYEPFGELFVAVDDSKAFDISLHGTGDIHIEVNAKVTDDLLPLDIQTESKVRLSSEIGVHDFDDDPSDIPSQVMDAIRQLAIVDKSSLADNFPFNNNLHNIKHSISSAELYEGLRYSKKDGIYIETTAQADKLGALTKNRTPANILNTVADEVLCGQTFRYTPGIRGLENTFHHLSFTAVNALVDAGRKLFKRVKVPKSEMERFFDFQKEVGVIRTDKLYADITLTQPNIKINYFPDEVQLMIEHHHLLNYANPYTLSECAIEAVNSANIDKVGEKHQYIPAKISEEHSSKHFKEIISLSHTNIESISGDHFGKALTNLSTRFRAASFEESMSEQFEKAKIESRINNSLYKKIMDIDPPTVEVEKFYVAPKVWFRVLRNYFNKKPTLLVGDTGSGKTSLAYAIAEKLKSDIYYEDMANMEDPVSALVGMLRLKDGSSYFDPAPFARAIQKEQIILLDEINRSRPRATNMLFSCLDFRRTLSVNFKESEFDSKIKVHDGVFFMATANVGAGYSGVDSIDDALANRFDVIHLDYPSNENLFKIMRSKFSELTDMEHRSLEEYIKLLKDFVSEKNIRCRLSITFFSDIYSLINDGFPPTYVSDKVLTLVKGQNKDLVEFVENNERLF